MYIVPQFDLDVLAFAGNPYIRLPKLTKKVQRRSSLLAKGQLQGVFLASLPKRFLHVISHPIETLGRTKPLYTLMGTLVVVIADPVIQPLGGVGKGGEVSLFQKLGPYGFPEPLDLAQGHGVMRGRANVRYALTFENLLKLSLAAPGSELPPVVRQDLPGSSPLTYGALYHFEHGLCGLLPEQTMADDVTGVIVDHAHQIDRIHPLKIECKYVDLP
jgi:hypothetical protein